MTRPKGFVIISRIPQPNFDRLAEEIEQCSVSREDCFLCPDSTGQLCREWWDCRAVNSPASHAVDISAKRLDTVINEFRQVSNGQWPQGLPRKE